MANPVQKSGMFSWFELTTDDVEGAMSFYGALLGWQFVTTQDAGIPYTHAVVEGVERPVAGMFDKKYVLTESTEKLPPHWGSYITVDDADASAERVKVLGGVVIVPPTDIPGVGRFTVIQDPQGAVVSLIAYTAIEKSAC